MIFIDIENKLPTDSNILTWAPWTQAQWNAWIAKSAQLVADLAALDAVGKRDERNALIDANSAHWGALKGWLLALSAGKCWFWMRPTRQPVAPRACRLACWFPTCRPMTAFCRGSRAAVFG